MDNVDDPHASEDRESVKDSFIQFMNTAAATQYHETAFIYWFDNNYRSLSRIILSTAKTLALSAIWHRKRKQPNLSNALNR